jgi:hypothetical protein
MSVTDRILVAIGALALVVLLSGAVAAAWLTYGYGTFEVDVRSIGPGGNDVSVRLPGALVRIAALFIPGEVRREVGPEIAAWFPVAKAALSELRGCSDAQLLDVRSRGETVRVMKRGDTLLAEITSPRENVRVKIPLGAADAVIEGLNGLADAPGNPSRR